MCFEPPRGRARAAGGLLGVIGGEAWRGARGGFESGGPVSAALLDLCDAYVADPTGPPVEVAKRHAGVPGLAWLLPVALVRRDSESRERDVKQLAGAAGVASYALRACVAYVELTALLFAATNLKDAIRVATVQPASSEPGPTTLQFIGVGPVDGLIASVWALERDGNLASVLPQLVDAGDPPAESWVTAAAGGPLGVRDGCAAIPALWHRELSSRERDRCWERADALQLAAYHDLLPTPWAAGQ
jgi:hypothetical protein